jgi:hypothetical protein
MVPNLTLEAESDLERGRMMLQQMTPEQVLAQAYVLLTQSVTNGVIICQAARRICELEARAAVREGGVITPPAPRDALAKRQSRQSGRCSQPAA